MKQKQSWLAVVAILIGATIMFSSCGTFFNVRMTSPRVWLEGKDYVIQFSMANADKAQKITLYYRINDQAIQVVEPVLKGTLREYSIPASHLAPGRLDYYVVLVDDKGEEHKEGVVSVSILSLAEGKARAEQDLVRRAQVTAPREIEINADLDVSLRVLRQRADTAVTVFIKNPGDSQYRTLALTPQSGEYRFRIPSGDLEEGGLNFYYTLSEQHPDFGKISATYPADAAGRPLTVTVIGLREMAARMVGELSHSVVHQPPAEVPAMQDLRLSLALNIPEQSLLGKLLLDEPRVLMFYGKKETRTRFRSVPLSRDRQGGYTAVIDRRSLAGGVNCYYFLISALTRDVGSIASAYPAEGNTAPFVYRIVSLEELRTQREREYAGKVSHTPPAAGLSAPLDLTLVIRDAPQSRRGVVHFKKASQRTYRNIALRLSADGLTGTIPVQDLEEGLMTYYFTVSLTFPDVGEVRFDYPQRGPSGPLTLNVASRGADLQRLQADLARRIRHQPVTSAGEDKAIEFEVTVQEMEAGTRAVLYLQRATDTKFVMRPMRGVKGGFVVEFSRADRQAGYTAYYIEVSETHPQFGVVTATVPAAGKDAPQVISIIKKEQPKPDRPITQRNPLLDGIVFDHIKEPVPGQPLFIRIQIKQPVAGMKVELAYRVSGEGAPYQTVPLSARGVNFSGRMDKDVLRTGATIEYYFIIRLPGAERELTYPDADQLPLSFTVSDKGPGKRGKN